MNTRNKLKLSLQELRNAIDIKKSDWVNLYTTNCYAYALGFDIPENEIANFAYVPGIIGNSNIDLSSYRIFSYKDLVYNMYADFKALDIDFREVNPLEKIEQNEWKIALFVTETSNGLDDYHFLRMHENGIWYHKRGFNGIVTKYDSFGNIIKNPSECFLRSRVYKKCLSLKLK